MRAASRQSGGLMAGSFTGISAGRIETQRGGCPLAWSCIHYRILWLSRFASMQRGLHPLAGKHLRDWYRSFCRPFYMQSHRRCSSAGERGGEQAAARREAKQSVNIWGGIAAIRQPITKPAWLARMKRKNGTISTTSAAPQTQSPTQHRRLKSITGFSSRRRHNAEEPFGSANLLQQLRPAPPCLAPAQAAREQLRT